ncbi:hypothetical protein M422DRAFT_260449 [Sphaerobolus stellatus SS14]|uniref:Protein kinase domain-containing protein n=1 Tax=Sphaerobolus stellatus (strain SS14) TaxID=990650 RepID=A0A0C9VHN8_SPHS4|nr:hypothetical protein M422DRAFT_260448 [Sphaerobolus stellatus SS14]KIJ37061.1 hypothetical protein M422DRAFT_260449 [Sphaerobolus stellatus SS14]
MLRPRYRPGWVASWIGTKKSPLDCEDFYTQSAGKCMDAVRIANNQQVMIKKVWTTYSPQETEIGQYLSSSEMAAKPGNHCVPILDAFKMPGYSDLELLVMPLLRRFEDPPFRSVGEVIPLFKQAFEGIQFMHKHHVAHRDCTDVNILMDPSGMYPLGFHPGETVLALGSGTRLAKHYTRRERPPKYYLIDFGHSRRYNPEDGIPAEIPLGGADRTVPEFKGEGTTRPANPYPTDIYYLGNFIKERFMMKFTNFEFMTDLVKNMTQDDPSK